MGRTKSLSNIPGKREKRVFIGGNYKHIATLREVSDYVKKSGYTPILASEFGIDPEQTYDQSIKLLKNCQYAIFEETQSAGDLMELQETRELDILPVIFYQANKSDDPPPSSISSLVRTSGIPMIGYEHFSQLQKHILEILRNIKNGPFSDSTIYIVKHQWLPSEVKQKTLESLYHMKRKKKQ